MRILHLLNHTNRLNGHVHAAVDLACAQTKLGHAVCVASGGGDFDGLLRDNFVSTTIVDHTRKPFTLIKSLVRLWLHVRRRKPQVIHAHMMTSAVLAWPICKLFRIPLVTTVHNEFEKSATLMGLGTRVIAVSDAVSKSMQKRGIPESKLHVVLNGTIGSARFDNTDPSDILLKSPSVIFVGGLHPRKGLPDLMEAFGRAHARNPDSHLYILGGGPFEEAYREMATQMECADAIEFLGAQQAPIRWMKQADIFVLPSHADPAPLVLSEAREARCAVIGTNVDGIPQLLEYGSAGQLFEPRDVEGLAALLCDLLENPEKIEEWKARSQINIGRLTISRVAEETMEVYRQALSRRSQNVASVPSASST